VLTGFLIYRIVLHITASKRKSFSALALWLLNPYETLLVEIYGNIDILSTFLVVASAYFFINGKIF